MNKRVSKGTKPWVEPHQTVGVFRTPGHLHPPPFALCNPPPLILLSSSALYLEELCRPSDSPWAESISKSPQCSSFIQSVCSGLLLWRDLCSRGLCLLPSAPAPSLVPSSGQALSIEHQQTNVVTTWIQCPILPVPTALCWTPISFTVWRTVSSTGAWQKKIITTFHGS